VDDRIQFIQSDLFTSANGVRFDAIIANPPYVCSAAVDRLQPELRWEPRQALDGGVTGLHPIERLLTAAPEHLIDGGWLLMEIGADQDAAVSALAHAAGFSEVSVRTDYAGLPRVVLARR
jgi:release factor glutamine methyltransferase